jgi:hypothetical protein
MGRVIHGGAGNAMGFGVQACEHMGVIDSVSVYLASVTRIFSAFRAEGGGGWRVLGRCICIFLLLSSSRFDVSRVWFGAVLCCAVRS